MLAEITIAFQDAGLFIQQAKLKWMGNKLIDSNQVLLFQGAPVQRVEQMKGLGSMVRADCEENEAAHHRASQSWKSFHKWKHVFCCNSTSIVQKIVFGKKVWAAHLCGVPKPYGATKPRYAFFVQPNACKLSGRWVLYQKKSATRRWTRTMARLACETI